MDFVYICKDGFNEELKYSIRSVVESFPDSNIWVVGGKPDWYVGNYIQVNQIHTKYKNAAENLKKICSSSEISKSFILMNDDFYIINKPDSFNYYYDGLLEDKIQMHMSEYGISKYARVLSEANKKLKKMGFSQPLNYDVHTPIMFEKEKLAQIINLSNAPRSMYGNIYGVGGEKITDIKIYKHTKSIYINGYFLSSEDNSFSKVSGLLQSKFKDPNSYESDLFTISNIWETYLS